MADLRFDPERQEIVFASGEYVVAIYRDQASPNFYVYGPDGIHLQTWKTQLQAERMASVRNQQFPQWDEIPQPRKQTRADRPQKSRLDVAPEAVSEWLASKGDCPKCKHRLRKRRDRGDGMPEANCDPCGYAVNLWGSRSELNVRGAATRTQPWWPGKGTTSSTVASAGTANTRSASRE